MRGFSFNRRLTFWLHEVKKSSIWQWLNRKEMKLAASKRLREKSSGGMKEGSKSHKIILQNCCWVCSYIYTQHFLHTLSTPSCHTKSGFVHTCAVTYNTNKWVCSFRKSKRRITLFFKRKFAFELIQMRMRYYIFYLEKQSTLVLNKQEMTDDISNVLILEKKNWQGSSFHPSSNCQIEKLSNLL